MTKHSLYDGEVEIEFREGSHRYYLNGQAREGVSSFLSVIDKPALRTWFMNMALEKLGRVWDDEKKRYVLSREGLLQPNSPYTSAELLNVLDKASKAAKVKSQHGMDVGTETHQMVEDFLQAQLQGLPEPEFEPINPEAMLSFLAFKQWWNSHPDISVVKTEQVVYSRDQDYAGTYDMLLQVGDKLVMGDFKTTNISKHAPKGIYPEYFLQVAAYSMAHMEEFPQDVIEDIVIINASKQGNLGVVWASEVGLSVNELMNVWHAVIALKRATDALRINLKGS